MPRGVPRFDSSTSGLSPRPNAGGRARGAGRRSPDQTRASFSNAITGVVIFSVVGSTTALRDMVTRYFNFPAVVVEPGTRTGLSIQTDNPREVGADRIVNALAAYSRYGGPCIVIDFGTATTYDVVTEKGEFLGGAISPGIQTSKASLSRETARLPQVELQAPNVDRAEHRRRVQSGLIFGSGRKGRMIERIRRSSAAAKRAPPEALPRVCSTPVLDEIDPWLTLEASARSSSAPSGPPMPARHPRRHGREREVRGRDGQPHRPGSGVRPYRARRSGPRSGHARDRKGSARSSRTRSTRGRNGGPASC